MKKIFRSLIRINYSHNTEKATVEELKDWIIDENIYETDGGVSLFTFLDIDAVIESAQDVLHGLIENNYQDPDEIVELAAQIVILQT